MATLLQDGHFGIIASSSDGNDTLTKEEATTWLNSLKNSKDTTRGPFTGQTRTDMINALTYVTSDNHFEELAGIDGDATSISQKELQQAAKETGINTTPAGSPPATPLTAGQKKAKDAMAGLYYATNGADIGIDSAVRNAVIRGGPAGSPVGFSAQGVENLANANLNDDNIWGDVPKANRQKVQDSAKVLIGSDPKDTDAAEVFNGALQAQGAKGDMTLDEAKDFVNDPSNIKPVPMPFLTSDNIEIVPGVILQTKGMTDKEVQNVTKQIQFIAQDADGSKLIKKASEDAPISIAYENFTGGTQGDYLNNHIRLSKATIDSTGGTVLTGVGEADPGIQVLAHEFVHAATDTNGNSDSQQEETLATVVGDRILGRFTGKPTDKATEQKVYDSWMQWTTQNDTYKKLGFDNHIFEDLAALGITFDITKKDPPK